MLLVPYFFYFMSFPKCNSQNVKLLKTDFYTGYFCNDCGEGNIDFYSGTCCGNQDLINIRFEQSNGTWVQRVGCKNCKTLTGGAKKKSPDFDKLPYLNQQTYLSTEEARKESRDKIWHYIRKLSEAFREAGHAKWWEQYSAYLQTDKWKSKRAKVLERENWQCQGCGFSKAVHVHHTTYENLGDELLFQLVALCVNCHNKLHPDKNLS